MGVGAQPFNPAAGAFMPAHGSTLGGAPPSHTAPSATPAHTETMYAHQTVTYDNTQPPLGSGYSQPPTSMQAPPILPTQPIQYPPPTQFQPNQHLQPPPHQERPPHWTPPQTGGPPTGPYGQVNPPPAAHYGGAPPMGASQTQMGGPPPMQAAPPTSGGNWGADAAVGQATQQMLGMRLMPDQPSQFTAPAPAPAPQRPTYDRIDPVQMPSAVRDTTKTAEYRTSYATIPPAPGSRFWVVEEDNCSPRFMRSSLYNIPASSDLHMQSGVPFGLLVQPMAEPGLGESAVPLVDFGAAGPLRCGRCRAYINPFDTFIRGGTHYTCALCSAVNEVPQPYFCPLEPTGRRADASQRPELSRGSVEFVATPEYIQRPPMPPVWVFVIDVSAAALAAGLPQAVAKALEKLFADAPENEPARVAIVTYDASVHFYQVRNQQQPRMLIMPDIDEPFVPCNIEALAVRYTEAKPAFDSLLSRLITLFPTPAQESALGAALQAAYHLLEETGGKVFLFASSLPVCGVGALKPRDEIKPGSENESSLFRPQSPFYTKLAETCVDKKITVDLFLFAQSQFDVATVGEVAKGSGGHIYYYGPGLAAEELGHRLYPDLTKNLARGTGYDALMRVRCSAGLSVKAYEGHLRVVEGRDVELPTVDSDKTIACLLQHDESLPDKARAVFQAALLYTTHQGQRRIRVHTLQLPISSALPSIVRSADVYTSVALMARHAIKEVSRVSLQAGRNALVTGAVFPLYSYRKNCSPSPAPATQLVLPDSLQLLPALTLGLLKNPIFRPETRPDERMALFATFNTIPLEGMPTFFYPNLFPIHISSSPQWGEKDESGSVILPPALRLSSTQLEGQGAYLMDDGRHIYLWCGPSVDQTLLEDLTGSPAFHLIDPLKVTLEPRENERSQRVWEIIRALRARTPQEQVVQLALPRSRAELQFFAGLVEDKSQQGMSYVDFLCHLHKHIQTKISGDETSQAAMRAMVEWS